MITREYIKIMFVFLVPFFTSICVAQADSTQLINALSQSPKLIGPQLILEDFIQGQGTTRVIVNLSKPVSFQQKNDIKDLAFRRSLHESVKRAQDETISRLDPRKIKIKKRFLYIFGFAAEVTLEGLKDLTEISEVISINKDMINQTQLAQGIPLINATTVRNAYNGAGIAIAICDTGIDYTHPMLGGGGFPNSKVIGGYDFGQNDADPMDGHGHGTACAGIAAGDLPPSPQGDYIGGVAHNAKLYALKVTDSDTGGGASDSDIIDAWEWCVIHQNDDPNNPIRIISTSMGGGSYASNCDDSHPAFTTAAQNAVAAGITIFAASGNNGLHDQISSPACISYVNSVGAVYDANIGPYNGSCSDPSTSPDLVTCFSNTATFLDLLAPSRNAYTLWPMAKGSYRTNFGGTSAACPYAAGAAACLQSAAKATEDSFLTPGQVRSILTSTGDSIVDTRPSVPISKPRINLARAIQKPQVAAGYYYTVGIKFYGTVVAVGLNDKGQRDVDSWSNVVQVAAGGYHTVGLKSDGTVVAVGDNYFGQREVTSWSGIAEVAAGAYYTVGLKSDGSVVAVGSNFFGEREVTSWSGIVQVATGDAHTVGLKADGSVVAKGLNDKGQRDVDSWSNVVQVAAGGYHTVGLKSDGTVVAVGKSDEDQLEVSSWSGIVQVAAGGYHTVGLKSDGTVVTAGWNYYGQRDDVSSWSGIVQVAAGFGHTVGLKSDGTVVTAGWNRDGQREVGSWNLGSTSYSILGDFAPADCDVDGSNLAALIANASLIDLPTFSQNFGKNACR